MIRPASKDLEARYSRKPWTDADDQVIREGVAAGQTRQQLADTLGRTCSSVSGRLHILRPLRYQRHTSEEIARWKALKEQGLSPKDIARQLGVPSSTLQRHLGPWGLRRSMRLAEVKTIRQQRQAGKTLKEIAAQAGRAVPTIRHYTRDLGRRAPRWAEAETPRLQEYWGSGMPVKEIAAQMHRSVRLIQAKARKLGLRRKP